MGSSTGGGGSGGSGRQPGAGTAIGIAQDPRGEYQFGGGYSAASGTAPSTGTYFSGADDETKQRAQDLLRDIDAGGGEVTFGGQKVERMQQYESDSGNQRYIVQTGGRKREVSADIFRSLQGAFREVDERQKRAEEAQKELKALEKAEGERVQRETAAAAEAERQAAAEAERQATAEAERQKQADADKQRAAEIEAAQRQAEGRAIDERQRLKAEPTSTSLEGYERRLMEAQERAEFVSGDKSFVTSGTGEKETRVTGGRDGKPVLTRQGVERKAAFEQEELERLVSLREGGEGDPEEGKRNLAKQIIEEKLAADPTLPPGLKAIREINLRNQLKNLEAGGTPTFRIGEGGEFVTSGVLQPGEEGTGIAPNITSDLETMMDEREQEEQPTILQAEPEPEPEVAATGTLGVAAAPRGRRGTRSKRPGAGGTLLEGGGVLYD